MNLFAKIKVPELENSATDNSLLSISIEENIQTTKNLKTEISKKANLDENDIEIMYHGKVLGDNDSVTKIFPDSIIQVVKKNKVTQYIPKTYTKEDCERIAKLFASVSGTQINIGVRINILTRILLEYPEFRKNLGAQALIRDSVLFHSLDKPEVIEKVAENYGIICDAAEFIVKTTKKELARSTNNLAYTGLAPEEVYSDYTSSSSEEENSNNNANSQQRMIRRITHEQLQAALQNMGPSSRNSLSNIAQRNAEEQQRTEQASEGPSNSQNSPSITGNSAIRISPLLLNNALQRALVTGLAADFGASITAPSNMDTSPTNPPPESVSQSSNNLENMDTQETPTVVVDDSNLDVLPVRYRSHQYANELRLMREMGLLNDEVNANVLTITGGNVENAVNLVLTSNIENDFDVLGGGN